jgi:hypothetical protein
MSPTRRHPSSRAPARAAGAALGAALLCAGPTLAESISGVCPDGSIFVVRSAAAIPCAEARRVEPEHVPPIKPQYLPRPYAWEVFQSRQDPNNPYNLVGSEGVAPGATPAPTAPPGARPPPQAAGAPQAGGAPQTAGAPQVAAAAPALPGAPPPQPPAAAPAAHLELGNDEIRDLLAIVELSQERAPATLAEPDAAEPEMLLRLARSRAFEARLRDAWTAAGLAVAGPVLVFAAEARAPISFYANLTFAQGHVAYHPDPDDRRQLGVLRGRQGDLAAGEITLGYVVLPETTDLAEPMDIYWNDRRITAVLAPAS